MYKESLQKLSTNELKSKTLMSKRDTHVFLIIVLELH